MNGISNELMGNSSNGTVVYDGQCQVCRQLAFKLRDTSNGTIDILPLESPEAEELLQLFYPNGPEHDFYFVKDGSCSKGLRTIPKIARATGIRDFGGLVKEYVILKNRSNQSGDCDCDSHSDASKASNTSESGRPITRRAFTGAMTAGIATLMSGSALGSRTANTWAPQNLRVHVARVTKDGNGGFETTIEKRQDLIHSEDPLKDESRSEESIQDESTNRDANSSAEELSSDSTNLATGTIGSNGEVSVDRVTSVLDIEGADADLRTAASMKGIDDGMLAQTTQDIGSLTQTEVYSGTIDHRRFDLRIHAGNGPAVTKAGEAKVQTTMAGEIQHDLAVPVIDYVVSDIDNATVSQHTEAYIAGVEQLKQFHNGANLGGVEEVYDSIQDGLNETKRHFAESVDEDQLVAVSNHIGISGIPGFHQYALPPEDDQSDVVTGQSCGAECGCYIDLCCGCGLDIGVCTTPIKLCGCCVAGCGCGIECCTNI